MQNKELPSNPIEEMEEALKDLPEEKQQIIKRVSLSMQGIMPIPNPVVEKLTPEHITTLLENSNLESERYYENSKLNKILLTVIVAIILAVFTILVIVFRNHIKDIQELLIILLSSGLSGIGGYSLGYKKGQENS